MTRKSKMSEIIRAGRTKLDKNNEKNYSFATTNLELNKGQKLKAKARRIRDKPCCLQVERIS